jgi:hypothetical protein
MQVDAAVCFMHVGVELHRTSPCSPTVVFLGSIPYGYAEEEVSIIINARGAVITSARWYGTPCERLAELPHMETAMHAQAENTPIQRQVATILALEPPEFAVWKYYEERAGKLGESLWSVGTWLMALVGATLSLPFMAEWIVDQPAWPYLSIQHPSAVGLLASFGLLLCIYVVLTLLNIHDHIKRNWDRASEVLRQRKKSSNGQEEQPFWPWRQQALWAVLGVIDGLAGLAFLGMLWFAL